jgi:hypothetical protein
VRSAGRIGEVTEGSSQQILKPDRASIGIVLCIAEGAGRRRARTSWYASFKCSRE